MDTNAPAFYLASAAEAKRPCPRYGQCPVAQCLLCCARPAFSVCGSCATLSILSEVKPLTGEPDAGEPPVRFGGRGNHSFSLPLLDGGAAAKRISCQKTTTSSSSGAATTVWSRHRISPRQA